MITRDYKVRSPEAELISFIVNTEYQDLPEAVINTSKNAILDTIGVALAGSSEPPAKILLEQTKEAGGQPQSGIIGGGFRCPVASAALVNGTMAHALDYDDICDAWTGHPSSVLVSTILAMGERCHSSGKDILTAYVIGFEIGAKIGVALFKEHYAAGWHVTGTIGSVAGAAAAAKLLKLNGKETGMALGIAASLASGLRENFGTMTKPLHAGNAASNGVRAALLAKRGFTASDRWLTADYGFARAFGARDIMLDTEMAQLGKQFSLISPGIWLKYYPACGGNHSPIEAVLKLRKQHSLKPEDIVSVECDVAPFLPQMLIHHQPKTGLEGKFSLEFAISVALIDGQALMPQFSDERIRAPYIQDFLPRIKYHVLPELGNATDLNKPVTVTITLKNGKKVSITENTPTGTPANPMNAEQLWQKFEACTRILSPEDRTQVVEMIGQLENLDRLDALMGLIVGK
jgi:2-methylcitrate dehydratase PrpD